MSEQQIKVSEENKKEQIPLRKAIKYIYRNLQPIEDINLRIKIAFNILFLRMILPTSEEEAENYNEYEFQSYTFDSIIENISTVNKEIEILNEEKLKGFLNSISYKNNELLDSGILKKIVNELKEINLFRWSKEEIWNNFYDIVLESYIKYRKNISRMFSKIMVKLLPQNFQTIYDPALGTGELLFCSVKNSEVKDVVIYGVEKDKKMFEIALMNLYINNLENVNFKNGNSITNPPFVEKGKLKKFDVVISHLPSRYSKIKINREIKNLYRNFKYGFKNGLSLDFALLLHSIASLKEKGKAIIIMSKKKFIEKNQLNILKMIIEDDILEGVISFPYDGFLAKNIIMLIINKSKKARNKGKVIFYELSNFSKFFRRYSQLDQAQIDKIINPYLEQKESRDLRIVGIGEIKSNDYSLDVNDYLLEKNELLTVEEINKELKSIEEQLVKLQNKREKMIKEFFNGR